MAPVVPFFAQSDLTVHVQNASFKISSNSFRLISDKWNEMLSESANNCTPFPVTSLRLKQDDDPEAFRIIMCMVHNQSDKLPRLLSTNDLCNLANMCLRYDLFRFFTQHITVVSHCVQWLGGLDPLEVEKRLVISYMFGLQEQFELAWIEVVENVWIGAPVKGWTIALIPPNMVAEEKVEYGEREWPRWDISQIPRQILVSVEAARRVKFAVLNEVDVFGILFKQMAQTPEMDDVHLCYDFHVANWGKLIESARHHKAISDDFPFSLKPAAAIEFYPETVAGWFDTWRKNLDFRPCTCGRHCLSKIWEPIVDIAVITAEQIPVKLRDYCKRASESSGRKKAAEQTEQTCETPSKRVRQNNTWPRA